MSINRLYVSSKDKTNSSDLPSNFSARLKKPLNGRDIYKIYLSHIVLEYLPLEPTFSNASGYFKMNVTGIGDVEWTLDRKALVPGTTELIALLNSNYQTASSTGDSPFSIDADTYLITITLSATFTIDVSANSSGWKQIGYTVGDLTSSATVGGSEEITFSSSPNLSRTSVIYMKMNLVNDASGTSFETSYDTFASIPISGTKFGSIINYTPTSDYGTLDVNDEIDTLHIQFLDMDYNPLRLQQNALVSIELQLEQKMIDNDGDGIDDRKEQFNHNQSAPVPLVMLGN